jgi:ketosteroid isomerase-like protein
MRMRSRRRGAALVISVVLLAATPTRGLRAQVAVDRKTAEAAIIKADEAFCQATIDRDINRFLALVAEDATFGGGTPSQQRGRDAVAKAWAPYFRPDGPTLTWKPTKAEVLASGDVGYSTGLSEQRSKGPDGTIRVSRGNYLTVWRKQSDGSWKAVFDTGSAVQN